MQQKVILVLIKIPCQLARYIVLLFQHTTEYNKQIHYEILSIKLINYFSLLCCLHKFIPSQNNSFGENTIFSRILPPPINQKQIYSQKWRKHIIKYIPYLSRLCYIILYPRATDVSTFGMFISLFSIYSYKRHT